jgi:hypothetical protein
MFYIVLILLLISLVINIFLLVSLKRAFNQIDILEEWLIEFKLLIDNTYKKLKNIDERGMFEKDDDVGIIFKNIIEIINLTNKRIQIDADDKQFNFDEKDKK